tara:strand:- start:513 stop:719 length:207 start_codon:yes stop_codon:yes gene_type:complete
MAKRPFGGTFDAHKVIRSSYGSIDVEPHEDVKDMRRLAQRADVHNANAMRRYQHEQMIARMRKMLDRL